MACGLPLHPEGNPPPPTTPDPSRQVRRVPTGIDHLSALFNHFVSNCPITDSDMIEVIHLQLHGAAFCSQFRGAWPFQVMSHLSFIFPHLIFQLERVQISTNASPSSHRYTQPTPLLFQKIVNSKNDSEIWKKLSWVCRARWDESNNK